ncbi:toll/interleukin-1 receptor domain-containing protein [Marinifilum caeruleilacunae]|uniref:Toll/interleukin-1 receptor domain-containing protein n=1 Tax=Marinifilum caeruleilacunae TaxID=2499076 RepID=A0ABX1WXG6_9BACT|nr:toll/interleukin-1 receptor domain-containing protein [Marinifilum caeruleilacunae]NOU60820.1 toll/interleukin-1 receptor domain-containing protein [Marinifilum caeruleilacunae]
MAKVFISHQKRDREQAKQIADYLKSVNIDVYFDEFDRELQQADRDDNPKGVVAAIKKGIRSSTHMLCIISPNTLYSKWVPFEVGYGYDTTELATLTLQGIRNSDLPDYIKTAPIIRDIYDINQFVRKHGSSVILESRNYSDYKSSLHPLSNVMDAIIT